MAAEFVVDLRSNCVIVAEPETKLHFRNSKSGRFYLLSIALVVRDMKLRGTADASPWVPLSEMMTDLRKLAEYNHAGFDSRDTMASTLYSTWRSRLSTDNKDCKYRAVPMLSDEECCQIKNLFCAEQVNNETFFKIAASVESLEILSEEVLDTALASSPSPSREIPRKPGARKRRESRLFEVLRDRKFDLIPAVLAIVTLTVLSLQPLDYSRTIAVGPARPGVLLLLGSIWLTCYAMWLVRQRWLLFWASCFIPVSTCLGNMAFWPENRAALAENAYLDFFDRSADGDTLLSSEAKTRFIQGVHLFRAEKLSQAAWVFDYVIKTEPSCWRAYCNLAHVERALGEPDLAIRTIKKGIDENVRTADLQYNLAVLLYERARDDEAKRAMRRTLEIDPEYATTRYHRAQDWEHRSRYVEAENELRRVLFVDAELPNAQNDLGYLLAKQGRFDDARKHFQHAIHLDPTNVTSLENLASELLHGQRSELAVEEISRLIELAPNSSTLWFNLGFAYRQVDQLKAAIDAYRKAAKLDQNNAEAFYNLGYVLFKIEEVDGALKAFERALELNPTDVESQQAVAEVYLALKQPSRAAELARELLSRNPDFAPAKVTLGVALADLGEVDQGLKRLEEVLRHAPMNVAALLHTARVYAMKRQLEKACDFVRQVLAVDKLVRQDVEADPLLRECL